MEMFSGTTALLQWIRPITSSNRATAMDAHTVCATIWNGRCKFFVVSLTQRLWLL